MEKFTPATFAALVKTTISLLCAVNGIRLTADQDLYAYMFILGVCGACNVNIYDEEELANIIGETLGKIVTNKSLLDGIATYGLDESLLAKMNLDANKIKY